MADYAKVFPNHSQIGEKSILQDRGAREGSPILAPSWGEQERDLPFLTW
jgi:hypothetical protein